MGCISTGNAFPPVSLPACPLCCLFPLSSFKVDIWLCPNRGWRIRRSFQAGCNLSNGADSQNPCVRSLPFLLLDRMCDALARVQMYPRGVIPIRSLGSPERTQAAAERRRPKCTPLNKILKDVERCPERRARRLGIT